MKKAILLISILLIGGLVGCTTYEEEPVPKIVEGAKIIEKEDIVNQEVINNTIYETIYIINNTNLTCSGCNYTGTKARELELIRRIRVLESNQDKYFNDSECNDNLNKSENELVDCEDKLCEYNSSWC